MPDSFSAIEAKMRSEEIAESAIAAFRMSYEAVTSGGTGLIAEADIEPADDVIDYGKLPEGETFNPELLGKSVMIKLNGGLGTSMGLTKAKSLLTVKDGTTFLDIIARQIMHLRETSAAGMRCLLMNSFSTSEDTLQALAKYADTAVGDPKELELLQNKVPKLDAETLQPIEWPSDPSLEWCPPGHADLYAALVGTGKLDELLEEGIIYAFVSNSDNLGAVMDPTLLAEFADKDYPFLMEVTQRTEADKKGGHLAKRKDDGQLLLREVAQCPDDDLDQFQDITKHQYFNTNNIWVRLDKLKEVMDEQGGALRLPVIRNKKTVDPRDKTSPAVLQLETAMGAAIECFPGAAAVNVPRSRFAPVKSTADLFALRSDAYVLTKDSRVVLAPEREGKALVVKLSDNFKLVDSIDQLEVPSMVAADKVEISGPVAFEPGVTLSGTVSITTDSESPKVVTSGVYEDAAL